MTKCTLFSEYQRQVNREQTKCQTEPDPKSRSNRIIVAEGSRLSPAQACIYAVQFGHGFHNATRCERAGSLALAGIAFLFWRRLVMAADNDNLLHQAPPATVPATSEGALSDRNDNVRNHTDEQNTVSSKTSTDVEPNSSVSPRKAEANRRNSRRSTGPKTAAGKKRVSRNAIKHGFYSKWLLIQHPDGKESRGRV